MKKLITILVVLAVTIGIIVKIAIVQPILAGGGQVVGEKGVGEVAQEGPCPFGGDTPAGPSFND